MARSSDDKIFINGDYGNYAEIMHSTNALRRNNDESETKPKANRSWKWKHILKPIWDEKDLYTGNGLTPSISCIILPCDTIALVERLDILMASKAAGNTGVSSASLQAGTWKTVAKHLEMKAIDVGKTVAIDAGKKLVEKAAKRLFTPKSQLANVMVPPEEITKK